MKEVLQRFPARFLPLIAILLFFPVLLTGQAEESEFERYKKRTAYLKDNPGISPLDRFVDSLVKSFMQSPENCGLSIGISQNGQHYFYNYGEVKRGSKVLPTPTTIYEIGSLSNTFCGLLLAQAFAEDKLRPEDDIRKYLPGSFPALAFNKAPIRIKHLAGHCSGLPQVPDDLTLQENFDPANPYKHYSREQIFKYLTRAKLSSEPGETSSYSSLGIALLGIILENVYQQSFENLVKEKICAPLGLSSTAVHLSEEQEKRFADGYTVDGNPAPHMDLNNFVAAGGLRSATEDLLKYLDHYLDEKNLAPRITRELVYTGERQKTGLGWFIKKNKQGNTLQYESGGTFGSGLFAGFTHEKEYAVIVIGNTGRNMDYMAIALLNYLQK